MTYFLFHLDAIGAARAIARILADEALHFWVRVTALPGPMCAAGSVRVELDMLTPCCDAKAIHDVLAMYGEVEL